MIAIRIYLKVSSPYFVPPTLNTSKRQQIPLALKHSCIVSQIKGRHFPFIQPFMKLTYISSVLNKVDSLGSEQYSMYVYLKFMV